MIDDQKELGAARGGKGQEREAQVREARRREGSSGARCPMVIGWAERVDIPGWGISRLRAKIDTGARTSALHVNNIVELEGGRVRFDVILDRRRPERCVTIETPVVRKASVKPSSGHPEDRIFVSATVRIGVLEQKIELSLVARDRMVFRMLLGRSALSPLVLVDVSRRYLTTRKKRKPRTASVRRGVGPSVTSGSTSKGRLRRQEDANTP